MKPWQQALGNIRFLGPDVPKFREDVKLVYEHIEKLEKALEMCMKTVLEATNDD